MMRRALGVRGLRLLAARTVQLRMNIGA